MLKIAVQVTEPALNALLPLSSGEDNESYILARARSQHTNTNQQKEHTHTHTHTHIHTPLHARTGERDGGGRCDEKGGERRGGGLVML